MKRLAIGLTFVWLLLGLFQFSAPARAMVDDYCGNGWWWRWKGPIPPQWAEVVQIDINPATPGVEVVAHNVSFDVQNRLGKQIQGGQTYMLMHSLRRSDGAIVSTEILARGILPTLAPGQKFQIRGRSQTPKGGAYEHVLELSVR
jgi:hypothetical protein